MKPSRVAVIGGGIGGLTAAGMLARKGHAVTLFEATRALGGKAQTVRVDGLVFDTGPTVMTMPDTVRATFAALGAEASMPRLERLALQTHYRWADGREFSCWEDVERAADSAARVHEGDGRRLAGFFAEADTIYRAAGRPYLEAPYETMVGFMARAAKAGLGTLLTGLKLSTLDGLARKHFESEHLRQFVGRFATYAGASPCCVGFADRAVQWGVLVSVGMISLVRRPKKSPTACAVGHSGKRLQCAAETVLNCTGNPPSRHSHPHSGAPWLRSRGTARCFRGECGSSGLR